MSLMSDSFQPQDGLGPLHRHLHRLHPTCPLPLRTRQEGSKPTTWRVDRMKRVFFVPPKNQYVYQYICLSGKVIAPLNPGLVKTALNEAIAAADLCGCCFELIISEFSAIRACLGFWIMGQNIILDFPQSPTTMDWRPMVSTFSSSPSGGRW